MGMCRKMAAINDHFQSLENELEIRDRKIEQIAHDMNIVLTLFSKIEKRVARTEHRTQHQASSLKHLSNATTTKQDELASSLQNLDNKVLIPIFIICSIRNRVVRGTSRFTQMHSGVTARIFRPQKFSGRKTSASRSFPRKSFTSASFQ